MTSKVKKVATVTTVTKVKEDIIWEELRSSRGDFVAPYLQEITFVYTIHALDFDLSCIE